MDANPYTELSFLQRNRELSNIIYYDYRAKDLAFLIKAGVNVEFVNSVGDSTPLIYAAANGCLSNVALLLKAGANVEAQNKWHETALLTSIKKNHLKVAFLLFKVMSSEQINAQIILYPEIKFILACFNNTIFNQCFHGIHLFESLFYEKNKHKQTATIFSTFDLELKQKMLTTYLAVHAKKEREKEIKIEPNKNKLLILSDMPGSRNKISPRQDLDKSLAQELDLEKMNLSSPEESPRKEKRKFPSVFKLKQGSK